MLISKEHRVAILTHLFKEGVIVAKKDFNLPKHPEVEEASNLEVIKLMTSLVSRDLVSERFSWKHFYWFLNDAGIEYLREYLHLPEDMVPNTLKKSTRPTAPPGRGPPEGERRPPRSFEGGDRQGYRSERPEGAPRGFGRGGGRPAPA
eukprot:CAMPEP_0206159664 /NCGR_PEP_ID=MMETSP1474-20131121/6052_1 /ASSEMBLY_ACC=CAM_ASM_001110 /TAXON_ID=97495 /ORGANISM="Imantonia sp., Strain RCC918" /LENGTH=147 /DNA_ID=CAMNT_0053560527 /DNA_START=38 /DNA_END=481 /DNA_ORIENTATION=-